MSDFWELARQAEIDPLQVDFRALRQAYIHSDAFRPFKHIPQTKLMQITDHAADFGEVAQTCRNLLEANPMDLEARMLLAMAQEKLGETKEAEKNHAFAERMLDSILASGDGKSLETAIQIVAEAESWTVMRTFGIKAKSHSRLSVDGKTLDLFAGKLNDRPVQIYFDITAYAALFDTAIIGEPPQS